MNPGDPILLEELLWSKSNHKQAAIRHLAVGEGERITNSLHYQNQGVVRHIHSGQIKLALLALRPYWHVRVMGYGCEFGCEAKRGKSIIDNGHGRRGTVMDGGVATSCAGFTRDGI